MTVAVAVLLKVPDEVLAWKGNWMQDAPERYPVKTRKLKRTRRANAMLWLAQGERVWLVQRPPRGVWAGLWALPLYDALDELQALAADWPGHGEE